MDNKNEIISGLSTRVERIMGLYQEVKKENEALVKQNDELKVKIDKKDKHLSEIEEKYEHVKMAKSISASDNEDTKEMKLKINDLVREIDKCIALLNV